MPISEDKARLSLIVHKDVYTFLKAFSNITGCTVSQAGAFFLTNNIIDFNKLNLSVDEIKKFSYENIKIHFYDNRRKRK